MTAADGTPLPPITEEGEARIQAGIAADPDNPEMTDAELALRPAREVLPPDVFVALAARRLGRRGPGKKSAKVLVSLRLDPAALDAWKASGPGWQTRIGEVIAREAPKAKRRA
jgi:uncharacterized protein (DUF4415 family)